jgi:predicted PurR-regulated permease PerM
MLKISAIYGIVCGSFLLLLFYASSLLGIDPFINLVHFFFDSVLIAIFIAIASLDFKRRVEDKIFHFWQGMTLGFGVYLSATIIFIIGLATLIYFQGETVINYQVDATKFLEERKDIYIAEFGESGYINQIKAIDNTTAFDLIKSMTTKKLITGFLITPLIAIILRKKPK